MIKLTLQFTLDGAAFQYPNAGAETARILRKLADRVEDRCGRSDVRAIIEDACKIYDINGQPVGTVTTERCKS